MKNALQKIKSFKNRKLSNRISNYIRRLQSQSRRLQNQLFYRLPAELRRRYPSLNRLPDLSTIQHSPKLVMGLAGGLVGFAFLMILCLRLLLGSGAAEDRQVAKLPAQATSPLEVTDDIDEAVATEASGHDASDHDASDEAPNNTAKALNEQSSIAQDQVAENVVTQRPDSQRPADESRGSQRRDASGKTEFAADVPAQPTQSQSSRLATKTPRSEPALEIIAVPEVTSERESSSPSPPSHRLAHPNLHLLPPLRPRPQQRRRFRSPILTHCHLKSSKSKKRHLPGRLDHPRRPQMLVVSRFLI